MWARSRDTIPFMSELLLLLQLTLCIAYAAHVVAALFGNWVSVIDKSWERENAAVTGMLLWQRQVVTLPKRRTFLANKLACLSELTRRQAEK